MTAEPIIAGRYALVRKIGEGGMGVVWEGRHITTGKRCAIKLMRIEGDLTSAWHERFFREAQAPAAIDHPGIVDVFDAGVDPEDGQLFLAMELLAGQDLESFLAEADIDIDTEARLQLLEELLEVLGAAHDAGFVHRDLKPANVFLTRDHHGNRRLKLLDFGLAKNVRRPSQLTGESVAMGTPHYMSPEQWKGARDATASTDVWAFGVLAYEVLIGTLPFEAPTNSAIMCRVLTEAHVPIASQLPGLSSELGTLLERCLRKDPSERPQSAGDVLRELRRCRQGVMATMLADPIVSSPAAATPQILSAGLAPEAGPIQTSTGEGRLNLGPLSVGILLGLAIMGIGLLVFTLAGGEESNVGETQSASVGLQAPDLGENTTTPVHPESSDSPDPSGPQDPRVGASIADVRPEAAPTAAFGGESRVLEPDDAAASSFWSSRRRDRRFPPELAFDGDRATAWNEGAAGPGDGEWLEARYDTAVHVESVAFDTGWDLVRDDGRDLFVVNSHLREVAVQVDGVEVARARLAPDQRRARLTVDAEGRSIRLVAIRVWPGTDHEDLAISEFEVIGQSLNGVEP